MDVNAASKRGRCYSMLVCALLGSATLAVYWPVRQFEFINFDDPQYVTENAHLQVGLNARAIAWAFQAGYAANWHPLTWISHMLDVQLFGLNPAGHHLTSLLFHTANTILLFLLLRQMTGAQWRSALVAALFALHPLHVESVAWVAERKDVLSTFFGLLSLWAYVRYAQSKVPGAPATHHAPRTPPPVSRFYLLSLLLFALSLMSKAMLVTLPFLLLLLDYWPLGRWQPGTGAGRTARRLLLEKVPFLVFSASAILATLMVQEAAMQYFRQLALSARAANAVVSCARYLGKTFWPEDLAVFYPHPMHWPVSVVGGASVLVVLITGLAVLGWRKRPYCVVGWFWFLGLLVPVLGLVQVGAQAMADRYTYLPLTGLSLALVWTVAEGSRRWPHPPRILLFGSLAFLLICADLSRRQVGYWRNSSTLFEHALAVTSGNFIAHNNLGEMLSRHGRLQEAEHHLTAAVQFNPNLPEAQYELGHVLSQEGRISEAIQWYRRALNLRPDWPGVLNNLAWLQATHPSAEFRNGGEAVPLAERACNLTGRTNLWLLSTLAAAYAEAGRYSEALGIQQRVCDLAVVQGQSNLLERFVCRLELYRSGQPYHEP